MRLLGTVVGLALLSAQAASANVTPNKCSAFAVVTNGVAVNAITVPVNGGYIWNPAANSGFIYVNPTGAATLGEGGPTGTNYPLAPGGSPYYVIPHSSLPVSVNAGGAKSFGCVAW